MSNLDLRIGDRVGYVTPPYLPTFPYWQLQRFAIAVVREIEDWGVYCDDPNGWGISVFWDDVLPPF
ncbi:hypothetical protein IQ268_09160 [Oculatella sp. LEGE 06141]|uniref:hypothetical protein n=1 Tax=Oculatella sp. LEGE 06141 TaxID=1828648 RepID=UPI00187F63D7|nr:hypothetical protein [Oculatella sp. LEGE 06141]MBE9178728.1 hypothetical protein [Oculatella sp. LEGE 06141]